MRPTLLVSLWTTAQIAWGEARIFQKPTNARPSSVETIPDGYIIKLKGHIKETTASEHLNWLKNEIDRSDEGDLELRKRYYQSDTIATHFTGLKHTFNIGSTFRGYAGHFNPYNVEKIRQHPDVSENLPRR